MFDPGTATMVNAFVGTGATLYGNEQAMNEAEKISDINRLINAQNAAKEKRRIQREARMLKGKQITSSVFAGVKATEGTPLFLQSETDRLAAEDMDTVDFNARVNDQAIKSNLKSFKQQTTMDSINSVLQLTKTTSNVGGNNA